MTTEDRILRAPNPWTPTAEIVGCPSCYEPETLAMLCDVPDCGREADCGWPSPAGYRRTCGRHMRELAS